MPTTTTRAKGRCTSEPALVEVTRRRIYVETLQSVLPNIRSEIIVDEQTRHILPLLHLDSDKGERS